MPHMNMPTDDLNDCLEELPTNDSRQLTDAEKRRALIHLSSLSESLILDECEIVSDLPNFLENQTIKSGL